MKSFNKNPTKRNHKFLPINSHVVIILLFVITTNGIYAQKFPLTDFAKVYFNKEKYGIEQYQTDSTWKSKKEFLNRLGLIDSKSYSDLKDLMEMNGDNFPSSFYITDIDKNGVQEYIISEYYEGISNYCFTFKNNKLVKFLSDIPFEDMWIENPQKIWVMTANSYLDAESGVVSIPSCIYQFNLTTLQNKYLFKVYKAKQSLYNDTTNQDIYLAQPKIFDRPKKIILRLPTVLYADYSISDKYQNNGSINKGSYGWVIADTLNSYFTVFDSTSNVSGSLGFGDTNSPEKGYIMCWIPKKVAEFSLENEICGLYEDLSSKEYLRVVQTKDNLYINYFSGKSFEKSLLIDSSDPAANKYTVRFKKGGEKYLLELKDNYTMIECTNPNQTKQKFNRVQ